MFAKKVPFAIIVLAIALAGCAKGGRVGPLDSPGGPIIVLEPVPDTMAIATAVCADWPCWRIDCPVNGSANGLPAPASYTETLTGIPWRLRKSAEKILVELVTLPDPQRPENPIDASKVEVTFESGKSVTIELPAKDTTPTWTFQSENASQAPKKLTARWLVYLPNWPHDLFGGVASVNVTYRSDPKITIPVDHANVKAIRVYYNRKASDKDCE